MSKKQPAIFYIKFKNISRFTEPQLVELFKTHSEISIVFPCGDRLALTKSSGLFYSVGELDYLSLAYFERFAGLYYYNESYKKGQRYYMSNQSEYFHPSEDELAVMALMKRARQEDRGFRATKLGGSISDVKAEDDRRKAFPKTSLCDQ